LRRKNACQLCGSAKSLQFYTRPRNSAIIFPQRSRLKYLEPRFERPELR